MAPGMPCHHGEALECTGTQWTPGAQRALRFDNHIKVLATSVGVREKGLLAGFNPPKLESLTLSPVREGGQQPSICQPPRTGLRGLIFYQKQREKRSGPGHHVECCFALYTNISRGVQLVLFSATRKIKFALPSKFETLLNVYQHFLGVYVYFVYKYKYIHIYIYIYITSRKSR